MDYDYYFIYLQDGNVSPTSETNSFSHFKPSGDRRVGTKNTRSNTCPGPAKVLTEEENPKENTETNQKVSEFRFSGSLELGKRDKISSVPSFIGYKITNGLTNWLKK